MFIPFYFSYLLLIDCTVCKVLAIVAILFKCLILNKSTVYNFFKLLCIFVHYK